MQLFFLVHGYTALRRDYFMETAIMLSATVAGTIDNRGYQHCFENDF